MDIDPKTKEKIEAEAIAKAKADADEIKAAKVKAAKAQTVDSAVYDNTEMLIDHKETASDVKKNDWNRWAHIVKESGKVVKDLIQGKAMSTTTASGATRNAFEANIVLMLREIPGLNQIVTRLPSTDGTLDVPTQTSQLTAAIIGENAAITASDMAIGTKPIVAYNLASRSVQSRQLFQDSAISPAITQVVTQDMADAIAEGENKYLVSGTGSSQPAGITAYQRTAAATSNKIAATYVGTKGTANAISLTALRSGMRKINSRERSQCVWLMAERTATVLEGQTESGTLVWSNPTRDGNIGMVGLQDRLFNRPVVVVDDTWIAANLSLVGSTASKGTSIFFGNPRTLYVNDRTGIEVDSDQSGVYFNNNQIAFRVQRRFGCDLVRLASWHQFDYDAS